MRLLPDTNTLNYLLKRLPPVVERFQEATEKKAEFLLSSVTHYELTRYLDLKGARKVMEAYERITGSWRRCDVDFEGWDEAARLWARRHRLGRAVPSPISICSWRPWLGARMRCSSPAT